MNTRRLVHAFVLNALGAACAPDLVRIPQHEADVALIARQTLLRARRVDPSVAYPPAGFSVEFVQTPADLGCGSKCVGTGFRDAAGRWLIFVAEVDERGQAPTRNPRRTPVAHELVHVLFPADTAHTRPELWGPGGVVQEVYTDLTAFADGAED